MYRPKVGISPLMFPCLLQEFLAYIDILSITVTWFIPFVAHDFFFLLTAPRIFMPGLGWKDECEMAPFHVVLRLAPLGP